MVSSNSSVNLVLFGKTHTIESNDIPSLNPFTLLTAERFAVNTKEISSTYTTLNEKVKSTASLQKEFTLARANSKKEKILALCKTILYVAFVAGAVLGIIALAKARIHPGIITGAMGIAFIATGIFSQVLIKEPPGNGYVFVANMIICPFVVLHKAWTKVAKANNRWKTSKNELEKQFEKIVSFYKNDYKAVQANLIELIKDCHAAYRSVSKINNTLSNFDKEIGRMKDTIQKNITQYEEAAAQLEAAKPFFEKYK